MIENMDKNSFILPTVNWKTISYLVLNNKNIYNYVILLINESYILVLDHF